MNQAKSIRHVLIVEESNLKKTITLEDATYSLGRHSSNDIIITSQRVSRHHATFLRRTDAKTNEYSYWILDGDLQGNRSRNGIYVNNKKCLVYELQHGDTIKFSRDIGATYNKLSDFTRVPYTEKKSVSFEQATPQVRTKTLLTEDAVVVPPQEARTSNSAELLKSSSFAELSPQGIIEIDTLGNLVYSNSTAENLFTNIKQKITNHPLIADLYSICNEKNISTVREIRLNNKYYQQKSYYLAADRVIRSYITDITKEKKLENRIEEQTKQYNLIFENSLQGIIIIDAQSRKILEANQAACNYLEINSSEIEDRVIEEFALEKDHLVDFLRQIVLDKKGFSGSIILKKQDGTLVNTNLDINIIDSTEQRKICLIIKKENNLSYFLPTDKVNSLPRIQLLKEKISHAIANAGRNQKLIAVLTIAIDNFENIKLAISAEQKIILLSSFAERLKACLRYGDTIAYGEKDNFFILMEEISNIQEVAKISQRILDSLQQMFKIGEQQLSIVGNIGISVYPQDGEDANSLFENSGLALKRVLKEKNSCYQFFNATMNSQNSVMLKLESFLYNALEKEEFVLYYQPQIDVNNGNVQGVEALLRWQHPELGLVSPNSFINLAEATGLIVPIGHWVLRTACKQNKQWHSQGFPPLRVSVNLSLIQFQQPDLPSVVKQILEETELAPHLLELEIAADTVLSNLEYSNHILSQLQSIGVHISIDNLTTSNTSWEKLKNIPFDTLKINRDFVHQLKNDPQDLAIIAAMVALGKGFNIRVVAEGVETQQQIEILRSQECQQMQGFWFSRPLAAEEATKLLPLDYME